MHYAKGGSVDSEEWNAMNHAVVPALMALIGKAPPEHIVRLMEVTVTAAKELQRQDAELCFKFMYPAARGRIDVTRYLDPGTANEMTTALNEGAEAGFGWSLTLRDVAERLQAYVYLADTDSDGPRQV